VTKKEKVLFVLFAAVPVVAFWIYQSLEAARDYKGTCGLLDAGWDCTKAQYVEYTLFNAFVFPFLAAVSIGWLILLVIATWLYFQMRKRRKTT